MTQHVPVVENVGNLICPASFKLGAHKSVLAASVPEGDDKPYKCPGVATFPLSCATGTGLDAWVNWLIQNSVK